MKKYLLLLIIIIFSRPVYSSELILSEYSSTYGELVNVISEDNSSLVTFTSLQYCSDSKGIIINEKIDKAQLSKYVPAYLFTGVKNKFSLYVLLTGKRLWQWEKEFSQPVTTISQDEVGEYIAVSDSKTVSLFRFGNKTPQLVFSKESSTAISALLPDSDNKILLMAEKSGVISIWSFAGTLVKTINLNIPINSIIKDSKKGGYLIAGKNGLFRLLKNTFESSQVLKGNISEIVLDNYQSKLYVNTGSTVSVYDYPTGKLKFIIKDGFGQLVHNNGAKFLGILSKQYLKLYDIKSGLQGGIVNITPDGTLFMPPNTPLPGVNASLINSIAGNTTDNNVTYDKNRVCAPIAAMVSGVYAPKSLSNPIVTDNFVKNTQNVNRTKDVSKPNFIPIPEIQGTSNPNVADTGFSSNLTTPQKPQTPTGDNRLTMPTSPQIKQPDRPNNMAEGSVPSWFANRKRLPQYNAVGSGIDEESSLKNAKSQIKRDLVKGFIKKLLDKEEVKKIEERPVMNRFLWMAAANAANTLEPAIIKADVWVSPAGQTYIHALLQEKNIDDIIENSYKNQLERFNTIPLSEYMAEKPISID